MRAQQLREQIKTLPTKPGVYLFRDDKSVVLYVGKAQSLRHRVGSYFGSKKGFDIKLVNLVARVADVEFIVTDSADEALILENTLIKRYRPRYNVRLRDDKSYPYLKIDLKEDFPRVYITRRVESDGARYFGPFASAGSVRKTLELLKRLFPYRSCTKTITGTDPRPCLDYYIHRCVAPCTGTASKEEYRRVIDQVIMFLEGRQEQVVRQLRVKMEEAAEHLEFERAAVLRDQVQAVERVVERQKVVSPRGGDEDIVAFARDKDEACFEVFFIRGGKLMEQEHFVLEGTQGEAPGRITASFIKQFYDSTPYIPPRLYLPCSPEETSAIQRWLESRRGATVQLRVPQRGEKRRLVEMAAQNAAEALAQLQVKWLADAEKTAAALDELQEYLNLPRPPQRVECYDISDIQGAAAVGSMVVFEDGRPKPAHYRRFRIKSVKTSDDYAMMREVLSRRFRRSSQQTVEPSSPGNGEALPAAPWAMVPDLVLIDGGRGHLNSVREVMQELGVHEIPLASIAKENEEIFLPDVPEPIVLPRHSQALYLVQRIRDEAHRFALAYHHKVRRKSTVTSALDTVPGIGPQRKKALIKRFGSVKAIREAPVDELAAVVGMTRSLAERVKEYV